MESRHERCRGRHLKEERMAQWLRALRYVKKRRPAMKSRPF